MSDDYDLGNVLHFHRYFFTDTSEDGGPRFGLVLLPIVITKNIIGFDSQIYCCVITKKPQNPSHALKILKTSYACLSHDSFICFDRRDYQALTDISDGTQPKDKLSQSDLEAGYVVLKGNISQYAGWDKNLVGVIIREWKKKLGLI